MNSLNKISKQGYTHNELMVFVHLLSNDHPNERNENSDIIIITSNSIIIIGILYHKKTRLSTCPLNSLN